MKIETIKNSIPLVGRKFLLAHMEGKRLTFKQAIQATCFECMNGFIDGKEDCSIPDCPLYPWMPYSSQKPLKKARAFDPKAAERMMTARKAIGLKKD